RNAGPTHEWGGLPPRTLPTASLPCPPSASEPYPLELLYTVFPSSFPRESRLSALPRLPGTAGTRVVSSSRSRKILTESQKLPCHWARGRYTFSHIKWM